MLIEVSAISYLGEFGFHNIVAAIGIFDGIHLGHRAIINRLLTVAKEYDAVPVVITFQPHPKHFFIQESTLKLLRSQKSKIELLGRLGINAIVTLSFDQKISKMLPEQFVDYLIKNNNVKLNAICVGENWKFGADAQGDVNQLKRLAEKKGFKLYPVEQVFLDGVPVSSTRIRKALTSGNLDIAYKMLDCNYRMEGRVITSSQATKCIIDYGIVPHRHGNYKIDLFTGARTIPLNVIIGKQNIKENSFFVKDAKNLKLKDQETVGIFLKPFCLNSIFKIN